MVGLVGYNYFYTPFAQLPQEDSASDSSQLTTSYPLVNEMAPSTPETATAEERALQNMSQREKVLLLIATPLSVGEPLQIEDVLAWLETNPTGMVTLFGSDVSVDEAGEVVSQVQTTYTTAVFSPIIAVDHEGGSVQRLSGKGFTTLPSWFAVCEIENPQERQELLASSAAELREVGVSMVFAPVVDTRVNGSPLGNRACSADQAIITRRAQEFITAFENKGVVSVIKHFPNIGKVNQDLHVSYGSTDVSPDEMIAFENLTKQNDMLGIMVSHAGLESIDSTLPCAQNIECVALARSNKDNLIVSDALEMAAALGAGDQTTTQAAIDTLKAGVDVIVLEKGASSESLEELVVSITAAVEQDSVLQSNIDAAALRVLHYSTFAQ
ncbi:glycoside hydrolase family 3 protein [Candidatus Woesebacteria bacterium]|nr:glycoside hydrolase family 3 protein [Candidatus Woesebacteria bacterium]